MPKIKLRFFWKTRAIFLFYTVIDDMPISTIAIVTEATLIGDIAPIGGIATTQTITDHPGITVTGITDTHTIIHPTLGTTAHTIATTIHEDTGAINESLADNRPNGRNASISPISYDFGTNIFVED